MPPGEFCRVAVLDDDTLRGERLTRSLYRELAAVPGVDVALAMTETDAEPGAKGFGGQLVLEVVGSLATPAVLIAAIREWCRLAKNRRVQIEEPGRKLVIEGFSERATNRLLNTIQDQRDGDDVESDGAAR